MPLILETLGQSTHLVGLSAINMHKPTFNLSASSNKEYNVNVASSNNT
jgi:hypothetical protein